MPKRNILFAFLCEANFNVVLVLDLTPLQVDTFISSGHFPLHFCLELMNLDVKEELVADRLEKQLLQVRYMQK